MAELSLTDCKVIAHACQDMIDARAGGDHVDVAHEWDALTDLYGAHGSYVAVRTLCGLAQHRRGWTRPPVNGAYYFFTPDGPDPTGGIQYAFQLLMAYLNEDPEQFIAVFAAAGDVVRRDVAIDVLLRLAGPEDLPNLPVIE